jgi:hypothetical protein
LDEKRCPSKHDEKPRSAAPLDVQMHELQRVVEWQVRELASSVLSQPE